MFAQHANPHARAAAERVVSRRDLHGSDDEGTDDGARADDERVRALHALVRRALGDAEARAPKRRKVEAPDEKVDVVPFRLLSTARPRALHLGPREWVAPVMPSALAEDDERAAERRAVRAAAAAVDAGWAMEPVHARSRNARPAIELEGTLAAPIAVLERPLEGKPKSLYRNLRGHELVSPHLAALAPGVCPVAPFSLPLPAPARRRRGPRKRPGAA